MRELIWLSGLIVLLASCGESADKTSAVIDSPTTTTATTASAPTTTLAEAPPEAETGLGIDWEDLRDDWAALDPVTPGPATFETGDERDSVQFTFDDGTIVQGSADKETGLITDLIVISPVDPQEPFSDLSTILDHWVTLLTITEPDLTPTERVGILIELGLVGDNLSLIEMNGSATRGDQAYEVVFDVELASFVLAVGTAP